MIDALRRKAKRVLAKVLPDSTAIHYLIYLPKLGAWSRNRAGQARTFDDRLHLYDWLNAAILNNDSITYLEFGVFKGDSIRYWSKLNTNPAARLIGFDTFTGLPETWKHFLDKTERGAFDVGGQLPRVDDSRVSFVKGRFQDSLPDFLAGFQPAGRLVVHLDADLYSATLYVLTMLNFRLPAGAILILDEFSSVLHEFRALEDYCSAYGRDYDVLAVTTSLDQVALRMK
ncbi:MAG: hypothetical protein JNN08_02405 [Bryobacterales bacterium]|nr:hypothetical protein [Bryobacterales bacterium]